MVSSTADAIVTRHQIPDSQYRISLRAIPALAYLPDEGHGTLIAPRWVVTAAHAIQMMQMMPEEHFVTIDGRRRAVSRIVVYPDFPSAWKKWNKMFAGLKGADPGAFALRYARATAGFHDIALLELAEPVTDVVPMPIDRGYAKAGMMSTVYGAGATGTDITGAPDSESHRTELRHAVNRLATVEDQWLQFVFDCSAGAPKLGGATAGGDSGGPVTIDVGGTTYLAGIVHGFDGTPIEVRTSVEQMQNGSFRVGTCGQRFAASRVSFYAPWIDRTIAGH